MIEPDVAVTITCTVVGVPEVVMPEPGEEDPQPLTPNASVATIAITNMLLITTDRLLNPAKAIRPSGHNSASAAPPV